MGAADVAEAAKRLASATAKGAGAASGVAGTGKEWVEGCAGDGAARWLLTGCRQLSCPAGPPPGRAVFLAAPGGGAAAGAGIGGPLHASWALAAEVARVGAPAVEAPIILEEGGPLLLSERSARDGDCCRAVSGCCSRGKGMLHGAQLHGLRALGGRRQWGHGLWVLNGGK